MPKPKNEFHYLSLQLMEVKLQDLEDFRKEVASFSPQTTDELEAFRIRFLGSKGLVKSLFTAMRNVPKEEKRIFGKKLNEFKAFAEKSYEEARERLSETEKEKEGFADLTLPAEEQPLGSLHPIHIIRKEIIHIFE